MINQILLIAYLAAIVLSAYRLRPFPGFVISDRNLVYPAVIGIAYTAAYFSAASFLGGGGYGLVAGMPWTVYAIFGAKAFSDAMKRRLASGLGADIFDIYGMTEIGGGTLGMDCREHAGLHVWEDHYLLEVVDPKTKEPLEETETGELVVTALTREALPLIRFRTADLTPSFPASPAAADGLTCASLP